MQNEIVKMLRNHCQYVDNKGESIELTYNMYVEQQVNVEGDDGPLTCTLSRGCRIT